MEFLILVLYGLLLTVHVWMLVRTLRKPTSARWLWHFIAELASVFAAIGMAFLFDSLRGSGIMPGMSYIMEFFYSLVAALVYAVMMLVSLIAWSLKKVFPNG